MSLPYMSQPSPAALMEEVRRKVKDEWIALYPAVSAQMQHLKEEKERRSKKRPNEDYMTITHMDLTNALQTGVVKEVQECTDGSGWTLAVNGVSRDGWPLNVSVYLPNGDSPLAITSFEPLLN